MPILRIRLLGEFQLSYGDRPRPQFDKAMNQPRLQALLAYLLLHRRMPQSRQHLAFTFWPDLREAQALTNLRKQLPFLRTKRYFPKPTTTYPQTSKTHSKRL